MTLAKAVTSILQMTSAADAEWRRFNANTQTFHVYRYCRASAECCTGNCCNQAWMFKKGCSERECFLPGWSEPVCGRGVQHPGRTVTPIGTVMKLRPPAKTRFTREMDERILGRKRRY